MSPSPLDTLQTQQDPNPWSDSVLPTPPLVALPLHTPSPEALADIASGGIKSVDDDRAPELNSHHIHADVLDTFDPLAHHEEQRAREAWANAEGHPPPPIVPPKQDPPLPRESAAGSASSTSTSTSAFPSFSSLTRSFALPSLPNMNMSLVVGTGTRARPQSLDTATLVQTPVHPVAFASQQRGAEISARGSPKMNSATALTPHTAQNALRRDDPSQERTGNKDKDPPFDFQKFLDQMKSKGAEPVARYLRSCVLLYFILLSAPAQ